MAERTGRKATGPRDQSVPARRSSPEGKTGKKTQWRVVGDRFLIREKKKDKTGHHEKKEKKP